MNINCDTLKAIQVLIDLLSTKEKDILKIVCNEKIITVGHQLIARWWNYKVIDDSPLVFQAKAAKILEANRNLIHLLDKIKNDDLFSHLMNPDNYKDSSKKITKQKRTNKVETMNDTNSGVLTRTLNTNLSGEEGMSQTINYSSKWEKQDVERLDSVKLNRNKLAQETTETGEEDHTNPPSEGSVPESIDAPERLDNKQVERKKTEDRNNITYKPISENETGEPMHLQAVNLARGSNITSVETDAGVYGLTSSLTRQNFETTRERMILADAINKIQNLEFTDIREKLYRKLDPLFYEDKKRCP